MRHPYPNEGRGSEECRRASVAALLGLVAWMRPALPELLAFCLAAIVVVGTLALIS